MSKCREGYGAAAFVALVGVLTLVGCESSAEQEPGERQTTQVQRLELQIRAVDGEQALRDVGSRAAASLARALEPRATLARCEEAVELARSAAHFDGNFSRIEEAEACISAHELRDSNLERVAALRADWLQAVHRFDVARALAERTFGAEELAEFTDNLTVATNAPEAPNQPLDRIAAERHALAESYGTYQRWTRVAAAERARGDYEAADAAFIAAVDAYRDVSPLALAWIQFQRGVLWGEHADDPVAARALYEDAVRYVPDYVVANVHLSELEAESGELDEAIARLERLVEQTEDPEPHSRLAQYYAERGDAEAAVRHSAAARRGYRAHLTRHPDAFADHASEFFAGPGADAEQAYALTERNIASRKTARAYMQAIEAAMAAGRRTRACELRSDAPEETRHTGLRNTLEQTRADCAQLAARDGQ